MATVNLDRRLAHLDGNWEKLRALKKKYGDAVSVKDPGQLGAVLITSDDDSITVDQMVKEFEIELLDDFFDRSRAARNKMKLTKDRPEGLHSSYEQYKKDYRNLQKSFNPVRFNPKEWVRVAKNAGMKYVVFTTKHHDGFCMFDTKETDYKITSPKCPYHSQPCSDIAKTVFNTFRDNGFMIGAYFSKPDWDSEYYWWPYFPTATRNANYDPLKYPDRWGKFKDFTYNQIKELMTNYGCIDILWLDGGQVKPSTNNQDIDMPKIAGMARENQPGIIIVDRIAGTRYENYLTPEMKIFEDPPTAPWETCMTMGKHWSYRANDRYKPARELIRMLTDIVAKGGNFLLNVGPEPTGLFPDTAISRLNEIGDWMKINSEAIYGTRPVSPYKEGQFYFTSKNNTLYAIYLLNQEEKSLPEEVSFPNFPPGENSRVYLLGHKQRLNWETNKNGVTTIKIPLGAIKYPPCKYAYVFKISKNIE